MADRPAHDPPQHIATPLVRRQDPVRQQECRRARVIRDHAHGGRRTARVDGLGRRIGLARDARRLVDEGPQQIGIVVGGDVLHRGRHAFEAGAGVDRWSGQRVERPIRFLALELHEDQVPQLHPGIAAQLLGLIEGEEAMSVLVDLGLRASRETVEVDLAAGSARPRRAHGPEVVLLAEPEDALLADADRSPEALRLFVVAEHRDREPLGGQRQRPGDELPGPGDRLLLEVVTEGEVPQHLEEGVMARREPDVLEVVVLPSGADAFLRRDGALVVAGLAPGKDVLELVHAGVREQQRRIVLWNERGALHSPVPPLLEEAEEGLADFCRFPRRRHGGGKIRKDASNVTRCTA